MPLPAFGSVKRIGVIGAGTIGASWSAYFLSRGYEVQAQDPNPKGEEFLKGFIERAWPALEKLGLAPGASPSRITFTHDPKKAVEGVDFVQEQAPERLDLKQDLLAQIDAALPADRVISSSTSSLMPSAMGARLKHKERLIVGHPFNPPHLIPLVEVAGGPNASAEVVDWSVGFYRHIGKVAIKLNKEIPGHVSNRLQMAIFREALHLVLEGVVSVEDVDSAISDGPGLRWAIMGPMQTFALAGGEGGMPHFVDHLGGMIRGLFKELGTPDFDQATIKKLLPEVEKAVKGRPVRERAAARDKALIGILTALKEARKS
ncbi:MAG: 3-hydroxyacyl-CoA dehydrogenase [Rhodospirillaceae bacterium]|nr:3-hydroxyacyl-CoA dehydrogenase [Rhodospirillaceae bacterium]